MAKHSQSSSVQSMLGLGPVSTKWLAKVGIKTRDDLLKIGSVRAYLKVKNAGMKPSLNLLWGLEAAITDIHWTFIAPARREQLKKEVELLDQSSKRPVNRRSSRG